MFIFLNVFIFVEHCSIEGDCKKTTDSQSKYKKQAKTIADKSVGYYHFVVYNPASFSGIIKGFYCV